MRDKLLEERYRKGFNSTLHVGPKDWIEEKYQEYAKAEYDKIKDWNKNQVKSKKHKKHKKNLVIRFSEWII